MSVSRETSPDRALLEAHQRLLERFRSAMNLVGPGPVDVHFADARRALDGVQPEGRWADLGTGAGFPGLVLAALHPHLEIDLVESRKKRCWFLRQVLAEVGGRSGVRVVHDRVERLAGPYDGILSRAFAPPERVLPIAAGLLREGGTLGLFLQDEAPLPDLGPYRVHHEVRYRVGGKSRRSVWLRLGDVSRETSSDDDR